MTKNVLITISGTQFDMGNETVELVVPGTYYFKNGKHYVMYEEQPEDGGVITRNLVKFYDGHFDMTKKGEGKSFLLFEQNRKTSTVYQTIAGPIQIDALTHRLSIEEKQDELLVTVKYAMNINYEFVSECEVYFKVKSQM